MAEKPRRSRALRGALDSRELQGMFESILGTGDGGFSLPVAYPKYLALRRQVARFAGLLRVAADTAVFRLFPGAAAALGARGAALELELGAAFAAESLDAFVAHPPGSVAEAMELPPDFDRVPAEAAARWGAAFAAAKKSAPVTAAVETCRNLTPHAQALKDPKALNDRFLIRTSASFAPVAGLPEVDFKALYADRRLEAADRVFLLQVLSKLYSLCHDVYETLSQPDVDVNTFVGVISASIREVQKKIPRCDAAFRKLADSIDLLKTNFGSYYRDYNASGDASMILQNFVLDVSKDSSSSPALIGQFRQIVNYYRKVSAEHGSDPKFKSLFAQVDANFRAIARVEKGGPDPEPDGSVDSEDGSEDGSAGGGSAGAGSAGAGSAGAGSAGAGSAGAGSAGPAPAAKKVRARAARRAAARLAGCETDAAAGKAAPEDATVSDGEASPEAVPVPEAVPGGEAAPAEAPGGEAAPETVFDGGAAAGARRCPGEG